MHMMMCNTLLAIFMDLETLIFNLDTVPCILIVERGPNENVSVLGVPYSRENTVFQTKMMSVACMCSLLTSF